MLNIDFEEIFDGSYNRVLNNELDGEQFFESFYHRFLRDSEEVELDWRLVMTPGITYMKFKYGKEN